MEKEIVVIAGPTAVGKTGISIEVALQINAEIVSCDSMQLYRFLDIGSAKPTPAQLEQVKHHLIDVIDPRESFSVARYQQMAKESIRQIFRSGKTPLVTGGTGLYLNSLLYEMDFGTFAGDTAYRQRLYDLSKREGNEALFRLLQEADPDAAQRIHPNNVKRVVRALEAAKLGGAKLNDFNRVSERTKEYDVTLIGLSRSREQLYRRIDLRVDHLLESGLLEEVSRLKHMGFTSADISMKGIGYKELLDFLSGECNLETAIDQIKLNTRHYAKRQMTWFKRYTDMTWFEIQENQSDQEIGERIVSWLNKKK